jgi:Helix-turn-helix of DDE superfamily endonuclease
MPRPTDRLEQAKQLKPNLFKRHYGVTWKTFQDMLCVMQERERNKKKVGRTPVLTIEEQVLCTLEFWREYPTYFHHGLDWGVHETTAQRIVERVEDTLIKSGKFSLPGKRQLIESSLNFEVIVVDVTEHPIERPKKSNELTTVARRSVTRKKVS